MRQKYSLFLRRVHLQKENNVFFSALQPDDGGNYVITDVMPTTTYPLSVTIGK